MAVESVIGIVAEHLLSEALSLAAEESRIVFSFKKELERLAGELEIIQALIVDADINKDIASKTKQVWLKRLEVVASDAEDVLEEYKYELLRQKVPQTKWDKVRNLFSPINKLIFRLDVGHKIKDISQRLNIVSDLGKEYGLNPSEFLNRGSGVGEIRMTSPSVQETEIVGRDEDVIKIVDKLINGTDDENSLALIGIVGMGGQGKTTIAQLVFKNDEVVNHFEKRIWVCVSDDFRVERILNEMVQSLTRKNLNLTNRQALIEELKETLNGKRYLLVLDDVWNEDKEKWESLKRDLGEVGGSIGTKIMVTTRIEKIVLTIRAYHTHHLSKLTDDGSWTLFKQRAFAKDGVVETQEFREIGQRLLRRCGGLPLAIKALGGLLYTKRDLSEWLSLENNEIWSQGEVIPSIKLSYDHLPSLSLKQCFAYCSIFPKDTEMRRDVLIQQWMAQGFLNPQKGSDLQMEDLGDHYMKILVWNCLLQESTVHNYNKMERFTMHDIVHDFALHISKGYCTTMNVKEDHNNTEALHLMLISSEEEETTMRSGMFPKLRTLHIPRGIIGNVLTNFRYLRSLIMHSDRTIKLPHSIGRLKHLRCIDIERTQITTLPSSFAKLYNLQTLKVEGLSSPLFLGTLINLRHLGILQDRYLGKLLFFRFVGVRHLVHLQTLPYFKVSDKKGCRIGELGPLDNLRGKLIIYKLDKVKNGEEAAEANIVRKLKVDHLKFHWGSKSIVAEVNCEDVLEGLIPHSYLKSLTIKYYRGLRFPSWMTMTNNGLLNNLLNIKLHRCRSLEQLPPLGHLPHLKSVDIQVLSEVKRIGTEFYGRTINLNSTSSAFPALEYLSISGMEIEEWLGAEDPMSTTNKSFPNLRTLNVQACYSLSVLPSLQGISSLTELTINLVRKLTVLPVGIQSCTSLQRIDITSCDSLQGLDGYGLERLPNLKDLSVGRFSKELDYFPWPHNNLASENSLDAQFYFDSLEKLTLHGWAKLTCLPEQVQHLPSLTSLEIFDFERLEALPEWLGNIQSLSDLRLSYCKNLKYIQRLTHLQALDIICCPLLKERCTRGSGSEWHKISHIRQIRVDHEYI